MEKVFELPQRYATKIYEEDDKIFIEQEQDGEKQKIILAKYDLEELIDILCDIADIGGCKP